MLWWILMIIMPNYNESDHFFCFRTCLLWGSLTSGCFSLRIVPQVTNRDKSKSQLYFKCVTSYLWFFLIALFLLFYSLKLFLSCHCNIYNRLVLISQTYGFLAIDHLSHSGHDKSQGFQTLGAAKVISGASTTNCWKNKEKTKTKTYHYLFCPSIQKGRLYLDTPWFWNEATNFIVNGASGETSYTYVPPSTSFQETLPFSILLVK